jgi:NAD(P)-dependent dehydrogenase (short-subunit alcohol dehydrogenase family)
VEHQPEVPLRVLKAPRKGEEGITLKGQRVAIIGGTSRIGLAIARANIEAGAAVTVASRRQGSVDPATTEAGPGAVGKTIDVHDPSSVAAVLASSPGPADHLVYTAGSR